MNKPLLLPLAALCVAGLAACSGSKGPEAPVAATPAAPAATPATTPAPAPAAPPAAAATEADKAADLAAKEQELARREADLAAREAALAQQPAAAPARPKPRPVAAKPPAPKKTTVAHAATASAAAAVPAAAAPAAPPPPVVVPAGTPISVAVDNDISTQTAHVGDPVDGHVASAVVIDGRTAIPAGTTVRGTVSEVVSGSAKIGGTPTLGMRFDGIELRPGRTVGISGTLHEQGKSDTARDTAKIAGGALLGAIIGKQIGDNKGRLIGGLLGGAAGVAAAQKTGTEVVVPAGTHFTVVLDQALTVD